jgi:AraC-like DNA-binding protein
LYELLNHLQWLGEAALSWREKSIHLRAKILNPIFQFTDLCAPGAFERMQIDYFERFGFRMSAQDAHGEDVCGRSGVAPEKWRFAVQESLRWGEAAIQFDESGGCVYWTVPVLLNQELIGGLSACETLLDDAEPDETRLRHIGQAAQGLLDIAVRENLVNQATMREAQKRMREEQGKAEAIHLVKKRFYRSAQTIYTDEEPALLAAIRRGERREATEIMNRIFVAIYHYGASSRDLLKSYLLELVAMMSRAAVEAGGRAESTLGLNFQSITALATLDDDEEIAVWLNEILDKLFTEIQSNRDHPHSLALNKAFAYMEAQLAESPKREAVARHVGLSSSHFAHLLSTYTGKSFRQILTELRVEAAAQRLRQGNQSLTEIALDCGFSDQSHFSRVFSKMMGASPGDYRKRSG